jgi:hypothetical protein
MINIRAEVIDTLNSTSVAIADAFLTVLTARWCIQLWFWARLPGAVEPPRPYRARDESLEPVGTPFHSIDFVTDKALWVEILFLRYTDRLLSFPQFLRSFAFGFRLDSGPLLSVYDVRSQRMCHARPPVQSPSRFMVFRPSKVQRKRHQMAVRSCKLSLKFTIHFIFARVDFH